uniref:Uncharacterized protein n=1 Tax=Panagrolaimus sp. PS1159 TaxID=55785 RepID=A0AC35FIH5_9BILA
MKNIVQLLSLFVLPTFISAIKCSVGGRCYGLFGEGDGTKPNYSTKNCEDACVYFKCLVTDPATFKVVVMEGAGCYEDFVNVCKWIPTKFKDDIEKNLENYSIVNETFIFQSCITIDNCATVTKMEVWDFCL